MKKDMRSFDRRALVRAVTLLLALCLCLALLPAVPVSADAEEDALNKLVSWGVMNGYPDGSLRPKNDITRAEFVALVNRAYGYKEMGSIPFLDVPYSSWYYDDISIAYNAGYFDGTSGATAEPENTLTREQALTLLARGMRLDSIPGEVTEFSDGRDFSTWSRGYVKSAYQKGVIGGYDDGSFRPQRNITRGEMAILLARAVGTLVNEPGEHTLGSVYGNVTINTPGTTLYDTVIAGDLYITGGLGLGSVILDNVRVLGSIIVAGGGVSEAGEDSIVLRNVKADELKIDSLARQYLSLRAEGDTVVDETVVRSDCYIQDRTQAGQGLLSITLEGANGNYTLSGNLEKVVNKAPGSSLKISRGTLGSLTIDEEAVGSKLTIESDATVKELNLDTAISVTGGGSVGTLNVNAEGCSTSMLPDKVNIRPGITANVHGETMDTTLGQEASSDPRILAGYPKAADVAPNTITAIVATNKSGTLYWAVSSITDGSVGETGLLSPAAYGSKAVKYGTIQVGKSNTDINISVTGLTVGGNYYFSAMLVDARNDRSPVKVISFATPDNTVPAFASGYPALTLNSYDHESTATKKYYAQFSVKATKSTTLYWATYTKGSTAPTAAEFRSGALAGAIKTGNATGSQSVDRNEDVFINVSTLNELTDYDIYFWLCDADGVKSSAVKKLTFKTVDGTPPEFNITPQHKDNPKATSITMTTNVNEAATVYWVAVLAGTDYPTAKPANNTMDEKDYQILQIVNGINGLKSGKVSVKANTDATFTISGLTAETAYDIWYVAKDTAGNYSVFYSKADAANPDPDSDVTPTANYVTEHTLDTRAPEVDPVDFSKKDSEGRPYPDTDIILTFSEDVLGVPISEYGGISLWELWEQYSKADPENKEAALNDLTDFLKKTIWLMYNTPDNEVVHIEDKDILDYENVEITRASDGKGVVVRFKNAKLDSGTTYRFDLYDLADTSLANNTMAPPNPYPTEDFTTVSSKIILTNLDKLVQTTINNGTNDKVIIDADRYNGQGLTVTENTPIIIDAAFSLKPEATAREDPAKEWDMIIWCDTSVTFELYRRYIPSDSGSGSTGGGDTDEPASTAVADDGINDNPDVWEKLPGTWNTKVSPATRNGNGTITISSQELGSFIGVSMFNTFDDFKKSSTDQRTNHFLKDLDEGATYEYAIHITNLDNSDEENRDSWSKDVTFQINIVAGTGLYGKLTNGMISVDKFNSAVNGDYQEVDDISEALKQKLPFQIKLHYEDSEPPTFATDDYPFFDRSDTSIKMTVQLNRKGIVYWYAAPVGSMLDAYSGNLSIQPTTVDAENSPPGFTLPTADALKTKIETAVKAERHLSLAEIDYGYLSEPTVDKIHSPTSTLDRIKHSSQVADPLTEITIEGLNPSTLYYIYVVLRGEAMTSYSEEVELFLVATTPPDSPILKLSNKLGETDMGVTTTDRDNNVMPSTVHYVIIADTAEAKADAGVSLSMSANNFFDLNLIDQKTIDKKYTTKADKTPYTVLDAMEENVYSQGVIIGTVFDLYATQDAKDKIMDFITGGTSGTESVIGGSSVTITERNSTVTVDCTKHPINAGTPYLFLAVAVDPQTTERGFSASPLLKTDSAAPTLDRWLDGLVIYKTIADTGTVNYSLGGEITLLFDKDLHWVDKNSLGNIYYSGTQTSPNVLIDNIQYSMNNFEYKKEASGTVGRAITLILKGDNTKIANISFKPNLCNASKVADDGNRSFEIKFEDVKSGNTTSTYVVLTYTDWNGTITDRFLADSRATIVELNKDEANMTPGETEQLTATVNSPTGEKKTVTWTTSNDKVATVDSTGKVTALKVGKAIITASIKEGNKVLSQATCAVTVTPGTMTLDETSIAIMAGGTRKLTPKFNPTSCATTVKWSSNKTSVADVSTDGTVTAVSKGTAIITAKATIGGIEQTATCTVNVLDPAFTIDPPSTSIRWSVSASDAVTLRLIIPDGFDRSSIESVEWYFNSSKTALATYFKISNAEGFQVDVSCGNSFSSGKQDKIYAKIKTNNNEYTSEPCILTLTQ